MGMLEIKDKSQVRKEAFKEIYESIKNDLSELAPQFNYQEYLKKGEKNYDNYLEKKFKKNDEDDVEITYDNQINYYIFLVSLFKPCLCFTLINKNLPYS